MAKDRKTGGRQKGTPNKTNRLREVWKLKAEGKVTPLEFLLEIMHDETLPRRERAEAARSAAPFVHPRLQAVEIAPSTKTHEQRLEEIKYLKSMLDENEPAKELPKLEGSKLS
jgi:hypothetical protein